MRQNKNTIEYWDSFYKNKKMDVVEKGDAFKFQNIAHYITDGQRVIDIGCGTGEFCRVLKTIRPHCEIWGSDFSKEAIKKARSYKDGIHYIETDLNEVQKLEAFDIVVSIEVLEHLDKPDKLIKAMWTVTKEGGVSILTTPYLDHIPSDEHVWEFNYEDIEALMYKRFKKFWVFPWADGTRLVENTNTHELVYLPGHWDTIMAVGVKI
jgi:2-polyprenyl-3-methyl-5-hydroxy-6-metoxy-1,4-benzoquinol methylase